MKRVVLCLSHSIEEFQQLDLLTSLGYEVFSIGGYIDPHHPHDPKRPPLTSVPFFPVLKDAVDEAGGIQQAQEHIPSAILEWLRDDGVIIYHHRLERLFGQWEQLNFWRRNTNGRIIWRSVGQSVRANEQEAMPYRISGLERIAYSPREAHIPDYSGQDAIIRFWGHDVEEPWTGEDAFVIQVSQHLRQRHPYTNWGFWETTTRGLPRLPIGPGSEVIEGTGEVPYEAMRRYLLRSRAFLFTGSQPASYTLGLIEAMMHGIPTVSIGPSWMEIDYAGHDASEMFEGHELATFGYDDPNLARHKIRELLYDHDYAKEQSALTRERAQRLFGREHIGRQWKAYLG